MGFGVGFLVLLLCKIAPKNLAAQYQKQEGGK